MLIRSSCLPFIFTCLISTAPAFAQPNGTGSTQDKSSWEALYQSAQLIDLFRMGRMVCLQKPKPVEYNLDRCTCAEIGGPFTRKNSQLQALVGKNYDKYPTVEVAGDVVKLIAPCKKDLERIAPQSNQVRDSKLKAPTR